MAAPRVQRPVVPVLHDVVDGDVSLAELAERLHNLILRLIALAALPEAQCPLRIERGTARQRAVARDDVVQRLAGNEVVVHVACHLAPDGQALAVVAGAGLSHTKPTIRLTAVGLPLYAQVGSLSRAQGSFKLIGIRVPGRAPTFAHYFLAVDVDLDVTGIVENELVAARSRLHIVLVPARGQRVVYGRGLNVAFVHHVSAIEIEALRQVLDAAGVIGQLRGRQLIFKIDAVLIADESFAVFINIGAGEMSFAAVLVVELEGTVQLQVVFRVAEAAVAVGIPQQAVVLRREHEGNGNLGVILEQILVLAPHVELFRLVLSQPVERLAAQRREELHLPLKAVLHLLGDGRTALRTQFALGHREVPELLARLLALAVVGFLQQGFMITIKKLDATGLLAHLGLHVLGLHHHAGRHCQVARLGRQILHAHGTFILRLRHNHQALRLLRQLVLRRSPHADNVIVHHLELNHPCLSALGTDGHHVAVSLKAAGGLTSSRQPTAHSCQHQQAKSSHHVHYNCLSF